MEIKKLAKVLLVLEVLLVAVVTLVLWYKLLLPTSYYTAITILAALTAAQMVVSVLTRSSRFLIIHIYLIFLLARSIYSLSMECSIIPFDDGNWDYALVRTYMQKQSVFVVSEPRLLTMYSGWPLLHTLAACLSWVSGIDPFYVALILPHIISTSSFLFVYLLFEKIRKPLRLEAHITSIALLLYAISPDSIYWPMQFVRQNLGILLLTVTVYLIARLVSNPTSPQYTGLAFFFSFSLVTAHHLTSFLTVAYLLLFSALIAIWRYAKKAEHVVSPRPFFAIALAMLIFLFTWWDNFASMVWPYITSSIERMIELFTSARGLELTPPHALAYPETLAPQWISLVLALRDILVYAPALIGFIVILRRKEKGPQKSFLLCSTLAFGGLFVMDNILFRTGVTRIVTLALPFIALLGAVSYSYFLERMHKLRRTSIIMIGITCFLVICTFIGLWGHNFAPLHLYDPAVSSTEAGERNKDFMRIAYFNKKVPIKDYNMVWTDDRSSLLFLIEPDEYYKINWLPTKDIKELSSSDTALVYVLKNLNLYFYVAGIFSPAKTPKDAEIAGYMLEQYLEYRFDCVYSDGKNQLWIGYNLR